jgi:hypothetical protein
VNFVKVEVVSDNETDRESSHTTIESVFIKEDVPEDVLISDVSNC